MQLSIIQTNFLFSKPSLLESLQYISSPTIHSIISQPEPQMFCQALSHAKILFQYLHYYQAQVQQQILFKLLATTLKLSNRSTISESFQRLYHCTVKGSKWESIHSTKYLPITPPYQKPSSDPPFFHSSSPTTHPSQASSKKTQT